MTLTRLYRLLAPAVIAVGGCSDGAESPEPDPVVHLVYISGSGQTGGVGTELAESLVVRIVDEEGTGVAGIPTQWAITTGGGALSASQVSSDAQGYAKVNWTVGTVSGTSETMASLDATSEVVFQATLVPGPPAKAVAITLDDLIRTGTASPVVGMVTDIYDNPVPGVPVTWVAKQGSADPATDTSGADGFIETSWTRGPIPGRDTLEVHLPAFTDPFPFVALTTSRKWLQGVGTFSWSTPAIATDGTIYYGTRAGELRAVNPDGSLAWSYAVGTTLDEGPSIASGGTIYIASYPQTGLRAISPTGTLQWTFPTPTAIRSTPAIGADGTIYVLAISDSLYAVDPAGDRKWAYPVPTGSDDSPVIGTDGTIYVAEAMGGKLHAIGPDGGHQWTHSFPGSTINNDVGTPALAADGTIYVIAQDQQLHALSPLGTELWAAPIGTNPVAAKSAPAIGADGTIFVGGFGNGIYAVSPTGTVLWNTSAFSASYVFGTPLLRSDGSIVYADVNAILYAVSPAGSLLWLDQPTTGQAAGSPSLAPDGSIYLTTSSDGLVAFDGGVAPAQAPWPMFMKDQFHTGQQE